MTGGTHAHAHARRGGAQGVTGGSVTAAMTKMQSGVEGLGTSVVTGVSRAGNATMGGIQMAGSATVKGVKGAGASIRGSQCVLSYKGSTLHLWT